FAGCGVELSGTRLTGNGGASSGSYLDSSSSYPLVRLFAVDDAVQRTIPARAWSATTATFTIPNDVRGAVDVVVEVDGVTTGLPLLVRDNVLPVALDKAVTGNVDEALAIAVDVDNEAGQPTGFTIVTAPAHGTLSGALPNVTYTPAAGFVGDDHFEFVASDCGGDGNTATVSIAIVDPPPALTCPDDVSVEAIDAGGASATWPDAIVDDNSDDLVVDYAPARDSLFALGSTSVTATVLDDAGAPATCAFQVIVRDTTAPSLTCPADIAVEATDNADGVVVTFTASAADAVSTPTVTSTPTSGSRFAAGSTTTVQVRAVDDADNAADCSFDVVVAPYDAPEEPEEPETPEEPAPQEPTPPDPPSGVSSGCGCTSSDDGGALAIAGLAVLWRRRRRR
ncbi:MAG TPA: HYR domain-containing protein, partial [Myxococcota bacterium]